MEGDSRLIYSLFYRRLVAVIPIRQGRTCFSELGCCKFHGNRVKVFQLDRRWTKGRWMVGPEYKLEVMKLFRDQSQSVA
jgi:hypothetical protein